MKFTCRCCCCWNDEETGGGVVDDDVVVATRPDSSLSEPPLLLRVVGLLKRLPLNTENFFEGVEAEDDGDPEDVIMDGCVCETQIGVDAGIGDACADSSCEDVGPFDVADTAGST